MNDCRFKGCDLPGETGKRLTVLDTCKVLCYSILVNSRAYTSTRSLDSLVMRTTGESLIPGDDNTWEFHFPNNDELTGEYDSQLHKHSTRSEIVSRIAYWDQEKLCDKKTLKFSRHCPFNISHCISRKPKKKYLPATKLKGLSHQIFKAFLWPTISNLYFLRGRWWFLNYFIWWLF